MDKDKLVALVFTAATVLYSVFLMFFSPVVYGYLTGTPIISLVPLVLTVFSVVFCVGFFQRKRWAIAGSVLAATWIIRDGIQVISRNTMGWWFLGILTLMLVGSLYLSYRSWSFSKVKLHWLDAASPLLYIIVLYFTRWTTLLTYTDWSSVALDVYIWPLYAAIVSLLVCRSALRGITYITGALAIHSATTWLMSFIRVRNI